MKSMSNFLWFTVTVMAGRCFAPLDAVDVIVVSPTEVERYKNSHSPVIKPTLQQVRVVYEAT